MTRDQREIHRKKRIIEYAERVGNVNKTCRYFGVTNCAVLGVMSTYRAPKTAFRRSRRYLRMMTGLGRKFRRTGRPVYLQRLKQRVWGGCPRPC